MSLNESHLFGEAFVDLFQSCCGAIGGIQFGHYHTGNRFALFGTLRLSQFFTPCSVAVCEVACFGSIVTLAAIVVITALFLFSYGNSCVFGIVFHLHAFNGLESTHTLEHFIPIYKVAVKLRAVDTYKLRLSANSQSACSTHAGSVYHNRVQRDVVRDIVLLCHQGTELHHDGRSDGKHLVDMLALDDLFHTCGDHTFFAPRTIVGHDDDLV